MTRMVLILCMAYFLCAQDKPVIAVNELQGHGVSVNDSRIVTNRLRSELVKQKLFRVMERGEMDAILQEQGFQLSGVCEEGSCLVEAGRVLGVEQLLAGSVGVTENLYTLDLKSVSIETGEITTSITYDFRGDIAGLLSRGIPHAAAKFEREYQSNRVVAKKGVLSIRSDPAGATLMINGSRVGETPVSDITVEYGPNHFVVNKRHFTSVDTTIVLDKNILELSLKLRPDNREKNRERVKVIGLTAGGTLAVGGVIAGMICNKRAIDSDTQDERDRYTSLRSVSYAIAGTGGVMLAVSFFF